MRHFIPGAILMLAFQAHAAPPDDADPKLAPWYNSLRQPFTNALCCSIADCRPVLSRLLDGHYEAFIDGEWVDLILMAMCRPAKKTSRRLQRSAVIAVPPAAPHAIPNTFAA